MSNEIKFLYVKCTLKRTRPVCTRIYCIMGDSEEFKNAVTAYVELHDEIAGASKQLRELKQQKEAVGQIILGWMKKNAVDECDLPEGKLVRKTSTRTEGLKKEMVMEELKKLTGDEARASASLQNIFGMRSICEKEVLSCTRKAN